MHNIVFVHIGNAFANLAHKNGANLFCELKIVVDDTLKEFAAADAAQVRVRFDVD